MPHVPSNQHLPNTTDNSQSTRPVGIYVAVCLAAVALVAGVALGVSAWISPTSPAPAEHAQSDSSDHTDSVLDSEDDGPKNNGDIAQVHVNLPWTKSAAAEPGAGGWQSEQFSQQSQQQLQRLGKLLENRKAVLASAIKEIVSDDFSSDALRPRPLKAIYNDKSIEVRRPVASTPEPQRGRGRAALADGISRLADALQSARAIRVHFKTFRITLSDKTATTSVFFRATGKLPSGSIQLNATWRCEWTRSESEKRPRLLSIRVEDYEEVTTRTEQGTLFADCTEAVLGSEPIFRQQLVHGVDHWRSRLQNSLGLPADGFHGLAIGDVDGNGLEDVYLCQPGGLPNRLLLHQADGTVVEGAAAAGVDWLDQSNSALLVDLDNDGDQDLVVVMTMGLLIHSNDGTGRFRPRKTHIMVGGGKSLSAADFDNDGDLDLYICVHSLSGRRPEEDQGTIPFPYHDANNGGENVLLRNDGNWNFTDATREVGLDANNTRFSLAAAWDDFDDDGDVDLYVANDFGRNCLYRNDKGHFTDVAPAAGVEDLGAGMSVTWGDYNNDGRPDIYVSNMFSGAGGRIAHQPRFHDQASERTRKLLQRFSRGNSLFENVGDGKFRDVTEEAGVMMGRWAWTSLFIDVNNDGLDDLLVANGMITQDDPGDL